MSSSTRSWFFQAGQRLTHVAWALAALVVISGCATAPQTRFQPAVASAHPLATEAGMEVLAAGGNAFDAAVATAAVLGVVEPYGSGLGGGGFWLLQDSQGKTVFVDARETAPGRVQASTYLDYDGKVHPDKLSINGPLAAGIPGQPAALAHISGKYGRMPLMQTLLGAISLARDGFPVDSRYREMAKWRQEVLTRYEASASVFLANNRVPYLGTRIRQPELADTLATLGRLGADGFYSGPVAQRLVADVTSAGGLWTLEDLAGYKVMERAPIRITYGDYTIWSAPLPSSGGVALAQMFGMMEARPLKSMKTGDLSTRGARTHYLTELMRRAYRDRAIHLGDPDFSYIPVSRLVSKSYLASLADSINMAWATPSEQLGGVPGSGMQTTHLSVLDHDGNRVSATLSINLPFGSGYLSPQTGVLLNSEMDDFSLKPGVANAYGLVGGEVNKVEPGKRPLSSMTPTLLEGPDRSAILGTPGGSRIITMVYLALLELMDGEQAETVVSRSRFHHQYLPDEIEYEPAAFSGRLTRDLDQLGHNLARTESYYGNMQLILMDHRRASTQAASDPRGIGKAMVGEMSR